VEDNERLDHETEASKVVEKAVKKLGQCFLWSDKFEMLALDAINYNYTIKKGW
jgi:hypothetical protein